jgi:heme oxygenase (biliverdin-producing, ferredoxin)
MGGLDAIKTATWHLHLQAERSGIIADIMAGRANQLGVSLLLRALLPVYQVLDGSAFGRTVLARSGVIEADLRVLAPDGNVPLLAEGTAYADRVRQAGEGLVAHAYVRYLGDLNGGRVMRRRLAVCLGMRAERVGFFDYPGLEDVDGFTRDYRAELDRAVRLAPFEVALSEALAGFELTIAVSEAVKARAEAG